MVVVTIECVRVVNLVVRSFVVVFITVVVVFVDEGDFLEGHVFGDSTVFSLASSDKNQY